MKQVLQDLGKGATYVETMPIPEARPGTLLIRTRRSLISAGTERMLVDFGQASLLGKIRQQPDKVRMVLEKIKTDGLLTTVDAVRSKLDMPVPLGYSNVGEVIQVGAGVTGFEIGERVVSNGAHAEYVCVPRNLCAKVPDGVDDESAAFTVVSAIGLQGIRLAEPTLGESFVVIGLGLIGLLTVQILKAQGCRVLGVDFDASRVSAAETYGAEGLVLFDGVDVVAVGETFSNGQGVDGVLITAATSSNEPVSNAAKMCRKRGRIILVGVAGLDLSRADFYEKEISFQVSCSYGPGRYDPDYELKGQDYPLGFVRWTEQRNFEAVLQLMKDGTLKPGELISQRFKISDASDAYKKLASDGSSLGILLEYPVEETTASQVRTVSLSDRPPSSGKAAVSVIGAGNYSGRILCPALSAVGADLRTLVTTGSANGTYYAKKFDFASVSTDPAAVFDDDATDAVVVATRHDNHASFVLDAIKAGKHVFVEKPLCLTHEELASIEEAAEGCNRIVMVGFNRRFSPFVLDLRSRLAKLPGPKAFNMTVNAGALPKDHWALDPVAGGGRLVGEACHFIDLLRDLAAAPIVDASALAMSDAKAVDHEPDTVSINLKFANGSIGCIQYFANGSKQYPKERLEVFCDGRVFQLDNFRKLHVYGGRGKVGKMRQDKGQTDVIRAFVDAVRKGGPAPIPRDEIFEVARVSIDLAESIR